MIKEIGGLLFEVREGIWDRNIVGGEIMNNPYHIPKEARIVIDIGAHIGGTTIKCAKNGATVYAYEPEDVNYRMLCASRELNNLEDKIHAFNLGVGTNDNLHINNVNSGGYGSYASSKDVIKIKLTTLEKIFKDNKIEFCDVLKLDCEGAEYDILRPEILEKLHDKIGQISVELHFATDDYVSDELKEKYGPNYVQDFKDMLEKFYKIKVFNSDAASTVFVIATK